MKYAVKMYHSDGFIERNIADSAKERDLWIKTCKTEDFIIGLAYCPIYKSGEYGKHVVLNF